MQAMENDANPPERPSNDSNKRDTLGCHTYYRHHHLRYHLCDIRELRFLRYVPELGNQGHSSPLPKFLFELTSPAGSDQSRADAIA
jgi:hypothetical protein